MPLRQRKSGLVSLEREAESIAHPFLKKAMGLAVDGTDIQELRSMLELQIEVQEAMPMPKRKYLSLPAVTPPLSALLVR